MSSKKRPTTTLTSFTLVLTLLFAWSCAKERSMEEVEVKPEKIAATTDLTSEYLYSVSTGGSDMEVTSSMPYFQGEAKIVKMKLEKDGLHIYQPQEDARFDKEDNESPVLTIPGSFSAYRCRQDADGDCTNVEEEVPGITDNFESATHFKPDFEGMKVVETNQLHLFNLDNGCISEVGTRLVHYEMKPGILNVELEKTYKTSSNFSCIAEYYFSDKLRNSSFKVKYFYSLARLSDLESKNYEKVSYPVEDHSTFGFFKTEQKRLNYVNDRTREKIEYFLNRWNPKNNEIVYHLSDSFNKEENLLLKEQTFKVFDRINTDLKKAGINTHLRLVEPSGKRVGDLRNNMINLIDDPLVSGILGYGPSIPNPRTGEIIKAYVNMYSGVLKSFVKKTYIEMVRLSREKIKKAPEVVPAPSLQGAHTIQAPPQIHNHNAEKHGLSLAMTKAHLPRLGKLNSHGKVLIADAGIKKVRQDQLREARDPLLEARYSKGGDEDILNGIENKEDHAGMDFGEYLRICSENNAFHESMLNSTALAKAEIDGISNVRGVKNSDGTLKDWEELDEDQIVEVTNLILVHAYTTTLTHEIGHNLGLRHNFAGSADKENFLSDDEVKELGLKVTPAYSSIMDYGHSELNELVSYGKYDIAALKFAYRRVVDGFIEVEDDTGNVKQIEVRDVPVQTTLKDFEKSQKAKKDAARQIQLKSYMFCTDENAGLSAMCNRFDEGTTLVEIANHMVEDYKNHYEYLNWRKGRNEFSIYGIGNYVGQLYWKTSRMRNIFERYEDLTQYVNDPAAFAEGCPDQVKAQNEFFCSIFDDAVQATMIIGNFLIDIIKTPDHTCAVSPLLGGATQFVPLREVYETQLRYSMDYVPKSCFDEKVKGFFYKQFMSVVGEAGKYLNDINDPDPQYKYISDIRVRGIWADKMVAMRALTSRYSGLSSSEKSKGSFVDHVILREKLANIVANMVVGDPLSEPIMFTKEDGSIYAEPRAMVLTGAGGVIPEQPLPRISKFFGLPVYDNVELNKALLNQIVRYTKTEDIYLKKEAQSLIDSLGVARTSRYFDVARKEYVSREIDGVNHHADSRNVLAFTMLKSMDHFDFLKDVDSELVEKVFKARTTLPEDLTDDQKVIISTFPKAQILGLIDQLNSLEEIPEPNTGNPILDAIFRLKAEGLQGVVKILDGLETPPMFASDIEKQVYQVPLALLNQFAQGILEARVELYGETLKLLPVVCE